MAIQWRIAPIEKDGNPVRFGRDGDREVVNAKKSPLQIIGEFMRNNRVLVLEAATGSGKTTRLPLGLLQGFTSPGKKVIATQPRVLNVTENVDRVSGIIIRRGYFDGDTRVIGFMTGAGSSVKRENRLVFYTEGVLIRRLLSNNAEVLRDVEYMVFDEVHERTMDLELLLTMLPELLNEFPGLKIIVTSATLNTQKFADYLGYPDNIASVEGVKPNLAAPEFIPENVDDYIEVIARRIENIQRYNLESGQWKDILVFLPTKALVRELYSILAQKIREEEPERSEGSVREPERSVGSEQSENPMARLFITELYRGVSEEQKNMAIKKLSSLDIKTLAELTPNRRVIISTNVAETGINFEELKYVIDSGWTNKAFYNPTNGSSALLMDHITGDVALQRWGRAGREQGEEAQGIVYCLYTEDFYNKNIKGTSNVPQIFVQNLNDFVLNLLVFKSGNETYDLSKTKYLDPPSPEAISRALDTLYHLYCIDSQSNVTGLSGIIAKLKTNPVHGKMIVAACAHRIVTPIIIVIAMLYVGTENLFNVSRLQSGSLGNMLINEHFSDHYNLWFLYKEWEKHRFDFHWCNNNGLKCQGFEKVEDEVQDLLVSLVDNGLPLFDMDISDVDKVAKVMKKALVAGLFYNQAMQDSDVGILYTSDRFPSVTGKVSRSFAFRNDNKNLTKLYPERIVYENLNVTRTMSGDIEYTFSMVTSVTDLTLDQTPEKKSSV